MTLQPLSSARSRSCRNTLPLLHKRKIFWLFSRICVYLEKDCTPAEAIDFAIDDCLMERIFYSLFIYRRGEVKELLLQQFPPSSIHGIPYPLFDAFREEMDNLLF